MLPRAGSGERARPTARSSARTETPTPCPRRPPAVRPCSSRRGSRSSSRCPRRRTRSPCGTPSRTRPNGGGIKAPLDVTVNGKAKKTMTLTSEFAWLYNQYPFTNDPAAGLLHPDWWIAECACVPAATDPPPVISTPFRPMHFYDEQRLLLGKTYRAGDKVRLTAPAGTNAAWTVIDLLDSELVGLAARQPDRGQRAAVRRRPDRSPRLGRRVRQGHRLRQEGQAQGLRAARHLPGQPAHHRRRRDHRGRRQLVHHHQGQRGRPGRAGPGRLGAHRRRLLRQGRGRRRQPQRAPVRLHHRRRRARAHRHRPGERRRRRAQPLHRRRPLHPAHQGRPVVRRPDDATPGSPTTSSSTRSPTGSTSTPA